jgi:hypothetical protein
MHRELNGQRKSSSFFYSVTNQFFTKNPNPQWEKKWQIYFAFFLKKIFFIIFVSTHMVGDFKYTE